MNSHGYPMNSNGYPVFTMNSYPYQQPVTQQRSQQQSFYFFGGSVPDAALVPQTSSQYGNALDANNLRAELLKEKALREKAEGELQQQKKIVADLTNRVQCAYFMMLQMQEAYKLNNYKQMLTLENTQLKEKIEQLEKENARLAKELESSNELNANCLREEENIDGFDVNEMYGTKNELLLMALNYDMTSRQSPDEFKSHS